MLRVLPFCCLNQYLKKLTGLSLLVDVSCAIKNNFSHNFLSNKMF